ncbi:MAG: hypothetical protein AAF798_22390 [Bacteroidota bacterium]
MEVKVIEKLLQVERVATISRLERREIPLKKDGWNFNWRALFNTQGSELHKIALLETPVLVEGVVMLSLFNEKMLFMNNIELAPHNIGAGKKYERIAGCLLAFACKQSFEYGRDTYRGYLSFDSKTELINWYQYQYGAKIARGNKMYFDPDTGTKLMKEFLNIT